MNIKFPVFVKDQEGYMQLITADQKLSWLEYNDIYNNEYNAWDVDGLRIELYLDKKEIKAKYISSKKDLDRLLKAIRDYAVLCDPEFSFEGSEIYENPAKLFTAVKNHLMNK